MHIAFGTDADAVTVTLFLLVVCSSHAPSLVLALLVELWCRTIYGTNLAEKEPFMHLLLPISCCWTSFQVVCFRKPLFQHSGRDRLGTRVKEKEEWLKHSLRNPKLVMTPSWTAFSSDTGYSDNPVWHFRRSQFSESLNHSSSEMNEAQGRRFRLGKITHCYWK